MAGYFYRSVSVLRSFSYLIKYNLDLQLRKIVTLSSDGNPTIISAFGSKDHTFTLSSFGCVNSLCCYFLYFYGHSSRN